MNVEQVNVVNEESGRQGLMHAAPIRDAGYHRIGSLENQLNQFSLETAPNGLSRGLGPDAAAQVEFYMYDDPIMLEAFGHTSPQEYVRICHPGRKPADLAQVDRAVRDSDRQRWPVQYAQFKAGASQLAPSTLLEDPSVDFLSPAEKASLRARGILTLHELANGGGSGLAGPGAMRYVQDAQHMLAVQQGTAPIKELEAKVDERMSKMEQMLETLVTANTQAYEKTKPTPIRSKVKE